MGPDIFMFRSVPAVCPSGASQLMMDLEGFEPSTSSVRLKRAPNCATGPILLHDLIFCMRNRLDFRVSRFYLRENKLSSKIAEGVEKPFVSLSFPDPKGTQSEELSAHPTPKGTQSEGCIAGGTQCPSQSLSQSQRDAERSGAHRVNERCIRANVV